MWGVHGKVYIAADYNLVTLEYVSFSRFWPKPSKSPEQTV
jgi:hypothetical protein